MPGPLWQWPALDLAHAIRAKDVSAREVMAAHLTRIEQVNPPLNAIVTFDPERALALAKAADDRLAAGGAVGLLHGLPIAHKDLLPTKGMRTTYGSPIYRDHMPEESALIVERAQRAGALSIGKTNTPEFGAGAQTFNPVFGSTRNPFDLAKTCGGSSGGSAVALSAGMVPLADGTDMGGSLRNPASFCGVVGLRPTPGLVPVWPAPDAWSTLSVDGPMARTVADLALLLSAIAGPDARSPIAIDLDPARFSRSLEREVTGVRVAWWTGLGGVPFEPEVVEIVDRQRTVFESLGCRVESEEPDFSGADDVFKVRRAVAFATNLGELARTHRSQMKATILSELDRAAKLTLDDVGRAARVGTEIHHRMRRFFERHDVFVLPVAQVLPFDVGQQAVTAINDVPMEGYIDWLRSCYYITVTGSPAIAVPCGWTAGGLPVGLQIVGRPRGEWELLQVAHAFEQAAAIERRWAVAAG
jgi:amidase